MSGLFLLGRSDVGVFTLQGLHDGIAPTGVKCAVFLEQVLLLGRQLKGWHGRAVWLRYISGQVQQVIGRYLEEPGNGPYLYVTCWSCTFLDPVEYALMQVDSFSQLALLDITFHPEIEDTLSDAGIRGFDSVRPPFGWRRLGCVRPCFYLSAFIIKREE